MKYVRQFVIILLVTFIGEVLKSLIPLPVPAGIYGLLLLLLALQTGILKEEQIKETGDFLIEIMPMMFIPAAVGLMVSWPALKSMLIPCILAVTVVTALVMGVTGRVTQRVIYREKRKKK